MLAKPFVVREDKCFVLFDGSSQRGAELVTGEAGSGTSVEEVACVEVVIAQELVEGSVQLIGSRL